MKLWSRMRAVLRHWRLCAKPKMTCALIRPCNNRCGPLTVVICADGGQPLLHSHVRFMSTRTHIKGAMTHFGVMTLYDLQPAGKLCRARQLATGLM